MVAVAGWERGQPVLFQGQAFVAGEEVEAFEKHEVGAGAGAGEGGESLGEQGVDGGAAVLGHGVFRDDAGQARGGGEGGVVAADAGVAREYAVFADEPRAAAGRAAGVAHLEGQAVEEIGRGGGVGPGDTNRSEKGGEKAVDRGEAGEDEVISRVRGEGEKVSFGLVEGRRHAGLPRGTPRAAIHFVNH